MTSTITLSINELKGLALLNIGNSKQTLEQFNKVSHRLYSDLNFLDHINRLNPNEKNYLKRLEIIQVTARSLAQNEIVNEVFFKHNDTKNELIAIIQRAEFLISNNNTLLVQRYLKTYIEDMIQSLDILQTEVKICFG